MLLRPGSQNENVAKLQSALNQLIDLGQLAISPKLVVDGDYGDRTTNAVRRFQQEHGLTVDGIAGDQTIGALAESLHRVNTPKDAAPPPPTEKNGLVKKLLDICQREVGVREVGGNNRGVRIREYQRATNLTPDDWPWCAAFVCWVVREWLSNADVAASLGWKDTVEKKRPKTAGAFAFIEWARINNQMVHPETTRPEAGMIVVFDFSHIGIVKTVIDNESFIAIEGNTNGRGDRDSTTGDGVWEKKRRNDQVRKFIGWHFIHTATPVEKAAPPALPAGVSQQTRGIGSIPRSALEFIIDEEGMDQPSKFPGGESGVTLGHGYDLGYTTEKELRDQWKNWLTVKQLDRLSTAIGKKGAAASKLCPDFKDIKITEEAADNVFYDYTVPKYHKQTLNAFPGLEHFPGEVQGALLSLVFNRGASVTGERRKEMKTIQDLVKPGRPDPRVLSQIASALRDMKRLWVGKGLNGLISRREREARMVEAAIV